MEISGAPGDVLDFLSARGASFLSDIVASTRRLPSDVEEALWQLAAIGRVTADSLESLRLRIRGNSARGRRGSRTRRARAGRRQGYSRWSLLPTSDHPDTAEPRARQLLLRYGVLCQELLAREPMAPRWRDLVRVLRRLEAWGEIRGGRFVAGLVGEQFALPEAVEMLRRVRNGEPNGEMTVVSACDPLNLVGIVTPGERVPAMVGNKVVFKDGAPLCSLENGSLIQRVSIDGATLAQARSLLLPLPLRAVG